VTEIAGSNVLVTGGASGIGRLVALDMARLGARIVIWDVDAQKAAAVAEEVARVSGRPAHWYPCDVSNREEVHRTAAQVQGEVGGIDILVNSAGVVSGRSFLECSDAEIERTIGVNTMALFWTCRAFLPGMIRAGRGHLVTIASAAGVVGVARLADYCASKWAAIGFDEALRMELRHAAPGVKTTIVCPYYVDTGMFEGVATRFSWILPILKEQRVAQRIVRAVQRNRRRLVMPWIVHFVPLLRTLPLGLFDWMADLLGINRSMDHFVGRSGGGQEDAKPQAAGEETS